MNIKKIGVFVLMAGLLAGCGQTQETSNKLKVVTSFYPLYDFAKIIAGSDVEVINLMGSGISAHDYEPSIQDRLTLEDADIFVYNGASMEAWVDKTLDSMNTDMLEIVNTSENVPLLHAEEDHDHNSEEDHDDDHDHGDIDPHIWLDPVNAISQSESILKALVKIDPDNAIQYTERFEVLKSELLALDQMMIEGMKTVTDPIVVMNHKAFSYMADHYGFTIESISGIIPDTEPSTTQLTEIIDIIKKNNINTILMESTSNEKVVAALVNEVHVEVLSVNTLESVSDSDNVSYVNIMKTNIENLLKAMK